MAENQKKITYSLKEISQLIKGEIVGETDLVIDKLSNIREAEPGSITFLVNPTYEKYLYHTQASAVIISKNFQPQYPISASFVIVQDPYLAFNELLYAYHSLQFPPKTGVEKPCYVGKNTAIGKNIYRGAFSYIGDNVNIGDGVQIYPHVYIGDEVLIGENTIIYSGAKIYPGCKIGKNCIIHAGVVIGSDGFGFMPQKTGEYKKISHIGNVVLGDHVEIGANTTIDRATVGNTNIGDGTKIDNLVQIAHNVTIGKNTVIAALTGVAGSATIGNNCMLGGQVGVAGHTDIGDRTVVAGKAGVTKSYKEGKITLMGMPAIPRREFLNQYIFLKELQKKHPVSLLPDKLDV